MFTRYITIASLTVFASILAAGTAFAQCAPCAPSAAYDINVQNGVTVMRGNMPDIRNPNNRLHTQRRAAEQRAQAAERRARRAERDAAEARAELNARRAPSYERFYGSRRGYSPRYNSGSYRFGASISAPRFRARGRGIGRAKGLSRPVFTRGIRS